MDRPELIETMKLMEDADLINILIEVSDLPVMDDPDDYAKKVGRASLESAVSALYSNEALATLTAEDFLDGFSI